MGDIRFATCCGLTKPLGDRGTGVFFTALFLAMLCQVCSARLEASLPGLSGALRGRPPHSAGFHTPGGPFKDGKALGSSGVARWSRAACRLPQCFLQWITFLDLQPLVLQMHRSGQLVSACRTAVGTSSRKPGRLIALIPTSLARGVDVSVVSVRVSENPLKPFSLPTLPTSEVATLAEALRATLHAGCAGPKSRTRNALNLRFACLSPCQPDTASMGLRTLSLEPKNFCRLSVSTTK